MWCPQWRHKHDQETWLFAVTALSLLNRELLTILLPKEEGTVSKLSREVPEFKLNLVTIFYNNWILQPGIQGWKGILRVLLTVATWLQVKDLCILMTRSPQDCFPLHCLINLTPPAYSISSHPWEMLIVMALESVEGRNHTGTKQINCRISSFISQPQTFVLMLFFSGCLKDYSMAKSMNL